MISALWLLVIIPIAASVGFMYASLCCANGKDEDLE